MTGFQSRSQCVPISASLCLVALSASRSATSAIRHGFHNLDGEVLQPLLALLSGLEKSAGSAR